MKESRVRNAFVVGVLVYFSIACVEAPPREKKLPPRSRWDENYSYHWNPPQQQQSPPAGLTVCVVRPNYGNDADSLLRDSLYRKFAKGFAKSMAVDLDKTLVTKGIRVAGPYETYDDITYPDKQSSDLALTPQVFLTATVNYDADRPVGDGQYCDYIERPFRMNVQGLVAYELREPLSKEKLWVKKLDLDPEEKRWVEAYEPIPIKNSDGWVVGWSAGKQVYDGKQDAIADIMEKWYPEIMQKAWVYLNVEEMQNMKPQIDEIRKMKRY